MKSQLNATVSTAKRSVSGLVQCILWCSVVCGFVWAVGAVWFFTLLPGWFSAGLTFVVVIGLALVFRHEPNRRFIRQVLALAIVSIYAMHLLQRPSGDRNWAADNAKMPTVQIDGNNVSISDFRSKIYDGGSEADVLYGPFNFQLSQVDQAWFVVQRFTAVEGIAHNFLTFRINDGKSPRYFSVSTEIRREVGESFSPVAGLFRQYELIYVIADERDQIGMRTVPRPDDRVFLYPVNATPEQLQQLVVDIAARVNKLRETPEFYHSLLNNCTNNIVLHTYKLTPEPINWLDPRIVAPGYADRVAYAWHLIGDPSQSFDQLQKKSRIDKVARRSGITDDFSERIRGLVQQPEGVQD